MKLNENNDETIKKFLMEMVMQDNRCTAFPYFYVIREPVRKGYAEHCLFLTEKDAENHLKSNSYRYNDGSTTYVKHVFRAPMLEQFFQALFEKYGFKWEDVKCKCGAPQEEKTEYIKKIMGY